MSDNKKYYYMKLKENFFDTEEMILLETMTDGYLYSNILMKLYLRSLKDEGRLMFKGVIPYTPEALASVVRHNVGVVEKAIQVFKKFGLIEILDNGAIFMLDIQNFIGKSSTEGDRKRESRRRIDEERELLRLEEGQMSGQMSDVRPPELEIELEIEKECIKDNAPLDEFEKVRRAYAEIHDVMDMPYSNSPLLTRLLEEGFTADLIIGIIREKHKPSVKTLKFYEGAIRDSMEHSSSSRSRVGQTGLAAKFPPKADPEEERQKRERELDQFRSEFGDLP